jgi:hypothetical protein
MNLKKCFHLSIDEKKIVAHRQLQVLGRKSSYRMIYENGTMAPCKGLQKVCKIDIGQEQ